MDLKCFFGPTLALSCGTAPSLWTNARESSFLTNQLNNDLICNYFTVNSEYLPFCWENIFRNLTKLIYRDSMNSMHLSFISRTDITKDQLA